MVLLVSFLATTHSTLYSHFACKWFLNHTKAILSAAKAILSAAEVWCSEISVGCRTSNCGGQPLDRLKFVKIVPRVQKLYRSELSNGYLGWETRWYMPGNIYAAKWEIIYFVSILGHALLLRIGIMRFSYICSKSLWHAILWFTSWKVRHYFVHYWN